MHVYVYKYIKQTPGSERKIYDNSSKRIRALKIRRKVLCSSWVDLLDINVSRMETQDAKLACETMVMTWIMLFILSHRGNAFCMNFVKPIQVTTFIDIDKCIIIFGTLEKLLFKLIKSKR